MFGIRKSIQGRLVLIFVLLTVIVVGASGLSLHWRAKRSLDEELGRKLMAVASSVASQIDGRAVTSLKPGDEGSRTYRNIERKLASIRERTDVKRVYLFDKNLMNLVDSEGGRIGAEYPRLRFDEAELKSVWDGSPVSSVLFEGNDGVLHKSGYAPIWVGSVVQAAVGVDGSATFLASIRDITRSVLIIGFLGILLGIAIAIIFSQTIVTPIKRLVAASERIGAGTYHEPIEATSTGEIGFLAKTMEEMRSNIVKRDRQLKTMLAGVAHEIRNPLGGIEIFAGLLAQELERDAEQKRRVERIVKEVKNLKRIVNDFLEYARPTTPNRQRCRISDMYDDVLAFVSHHLTDRGVDISLREENEGTVVFADPRHLKQVFLNLIRNSIEAMPDGGQIRINVRQPVGEFVEISFEDTGEGVSAETAERLFDPFFTTRQEGTGLGLAMVKKLIEDTGGQIEAQSERDKGLLLRIILPRA